MCDGMHSVEKWKISSNQLFSNFYSKTVALKLSRIFCQKKKHESEFLSFSHAWITLIFSSELLILTYFFRQISVVHNFTSNPTWNVTINSDELNAEVIVSRIFSEILSKYFQLSIDSQGKPHWNWHDEIAINWKPLFHVIFFK